MVYVLGHPVVLLFTVGDAVYGMLARPNAMMGTTSTHPVEYENGSWDKKLANQSLSTESSTTTGATGRRLAASETFVDYLTTISDRSAVTSQANHTVSESSETARPSDVGPAAPDNEELETRVFSGNDFFDERPTTPMFSDRRLLSAVTSASSLHPDSTGPSSENNKSFTKITVVNSNSSVTATDAVMTSVRENFSTQSTPTVIFGDDSRAKFLQGTTPVRRRLPHVFDPGRAHHNPHAGDVPKSSSCDVSSGADEGSQPRSESDDCQPMRSSEHQKRDQHRERESQRSREIKSSSHTEVRTQLSLYCKNYCFAYWCLCINNRRSRNRSKFVVIKI